LGRSIALDAGDPVALMIFPEMHATVDVPEITEAFRANRRRA